MEIISLQKAHWPEVERIYRQGIVTGNSTLETRPPDWEEWDKSHLAHSRLVMTEGQKVLGWAALTAVSGRCVYAGVAEISVYVDESARGQGIGQSLLQELIHSSEENGIWTLQAGILKENLASIRLHEKCGFRTVGYREKIGKLNNEWRDIFLLERRSKITGIN